MIKWVRGCVAVSAGLLIAAAEPPSSDPPLPNSSKLADVEAWAVAAGIDTRAVEPIFASAQGVYYQAKIIGPRFLPSQPNISAEIRFERFGPRRLEDGTEIRSERAGVALECAPNHGIKLVNLRAYADHNLKGKGSGKVDEAAWAAIGTERRTIAGTTTGFLAKVVESRACYMQPVTLMQR